MRKQITIEKIKHHKEDRIKVVLPNDNHFREKIKSMLDLWVEDINFDRKTICTVF